MCVCVCECACVCLWFTMPKQTLIWVMKMRGAEPPADLTVSVFVSTFPPCISYLPTTQRIACQGLPTSRKTATNTRTPNHTHTINHTRTYQPLRSCASGSSGLKYMVLDCDTDSERPAIPKGEKTSNMSGEKRGKK